jgi:hypothetical protein
MGQLTLEANFSFLLTGPAFHLQIPEDFDEVPQLSSPLSNGIGERSFDYLPSSRDDGITEAVRSRGAIQGRDGRTVELYERIDRPDAERLWWLRWNLRNGAIYTHLREEDGVNMAEVEAKSLTIVERGPGGTPSLLPDAPLRPAVSLRPGFQELALFQSKRAPEWTLEFRRPGFIPTGKVMRAPETLVGDALYLRAGTSYGMEVAVSGSKDLAGAEQILSTAVESLRELSK